MNFEFEDIEDAINQSLGETIDHEMQSQGYGGLMMMFGYITLTETESEDILDLNCSINIFHLKSKTRFNSVRFTTEVVIDPDCYDNFDEEEIRSMIGEKVRVCYLADHYPKNKLISYMIPFDADHPSIHVMNVANSDCKTIIKSFSVAMNEIQKYQNGNIVILDIFSNEFLDSHDDYFFGDN